MAEARKKLSEVQMQQIVETQGVVTQARAALQRAEVDAQRVVQLVFDAHGVPADWTAEIDNRSGELVCRGDIEDAPLAAE